MPEPETKTVKEYQQAAEHWQTLWEKNDKHLASANIAIKKLTEENSKLRDTIQDLNRRIRTFQC